MNITEIILRANKNKGGNVAIEDEQGSLTYRDLEKAINELVIDLQSKGIGKGMGVGVMGKNSRQFIIAVLALSKLEAVVMPISNQLKSHEVNVILQRSGLNYLINDKDSPDNESLEDGEINISNNLWALNKYNDFNGVPFAAHVPDAAIVRYTSGTTGTSKGVVIGHKSINERLDAANSCLELNDHDVVIWVLQMSYHFVVSILLYLKYGCSLVLCKNFLADTIYFDIKKHGGTFLYASPLHIRLLSNFKDGEPIDSLNRVISTSTAISKAQCEAFTSRYNLPVTQAYGIIEIGLPIINYDKGAEAPDAVGRALDNFKVEVLNKANEILPSGVLGHLAIHGPGMFDGYLSPAMLRDEILVDGWFLTGDLARIDKDGIIKVEGRKKSMINVAGNKVFPLEVEQVLNTHPLIDKSKVSGFQHRLMGEVVKAEIMVSGDSEIDTEEIIGYCRDRLSTYKIPQKIIVVEKLAMTDSGKLIRS